ncbi:diketogulonate reductase-like aldo/keto reductase [Planomicrobium stackebrandtii]|uniref:Diketogulonate reductase-like aldo/keto reductase n=1 Tax=Planomicrobium stackebrandtii TaxID=253160 RepID=A0ABU0GWB2_9BACL|nr:aldo/keto reductase [Planomicrobium stackebrandtii]MDQ0429204.1 diketogulonate reductase-like aldo/keto reductase [Planomicrobium stackebrandtii]
MSNHIQPTTTLHNGVKMPWLGLGVFKVEDGEEVVQSIKTALEVGYRSIDTAAIYGNEEGVGKAIAEANVPREELFITTKVWNANHGYEATLTAFDESMEKLGLDYLDLYLIHWPLPSKGKFAETWKALEKLYKDGRVRAIGVSNFKVTHLEEIIEDCEVVPMVNQVEYHPRFNQRELHDFCKKHGIQLEAWSPLMQGELLNEPALMEIAKEYSKSTAQIIIRWDIQTGVVTIPKSVKPHRIAENADVFDFEISQENMDKINALNKDQRMFADPDEFDRV